MGQGAATAITPQGRRTLTGLPTHNPATSSRAQPPTIAPVTLRPGAQWKWNEQTRETREKTGKEGETLKQESEGREGNEEKR